MKIFVPLILGFFLAFLPFIVFRAETLFGKYLRSNTPMLWIISTFAVMNPSSKRGPGMFLIIAVLYYLPYFAIQVFIRRGVPLLETVFGVVVFKALVSHDFTVTSSALITSIFIFLSTYLSKNKYPIKSVIDRD